MRRLSTGLSALIGTSVLLVGITAVAPTSVSAALAAGPTYIAIDAGYVHSCAILADHTVVCWGYNSHGEIGDGSTTDRQLPTTVSGITTAASINAGYFASCAVLSNHTIRCWGWNQYGQLGDGTVYNRLVPVTVSGISTATAVSNQYTHTCALLAAHTIRCWGANNAGQLGDGTTTGSVTPVTVSGITTATAIDAGEDHTCALLANGTVVCWGGNTWGQLGDGTTTPSATPVAVTGISTATGVSADRQGTCAILSDHTLACWGYNCHGQLGNGTTTPSSTPVAVSGITSAASVSRGGCHTCALVAGQAAAWGENRYGQLGDGTATDRYEPVTVAWLPKASMTALPTWISTQSVPVGWSATPGTAAVASYDVRYRRAPWNGTFGAQTTWLSATTATSATFSAASGSTYCFSARARDDNGLLSAWTAETCTAIPLDDRSLTRSSGWTTGTSSSYFRSTYVRSSTYGAKLTRTGVVAKRIALLATTCSTCGSVKVYWGSTLLKTVSLYSKTTVTKKFITVASFTSGRAGTLSIRVSSSGKRVIIDGVAIRRN